MREMKAWKKPCAFCGRGPWRVPGRPTMSVTPGLRIFVGNGHAICDRCLATCKQLLPLYDVRTA